MPKTPRTPQIIGVAEASKLTGLDRRTIHRMISRGTLHPAAKLDGLRGAYMLHRSEVEALAAARSAA